MALRPNWKECYILNTESMRKGKKEERTYSEAVSKGQIRALKLLENKRRLCFLIIHHV